MGFETSSSTYVTVSGALTTFKVILGLFSTLVFFLLLLLLSFRKYDSQGVTATVKTLFKTSVAEKMQIAKAYMRYTIDFVISNVILE